MSNEFFDSPVTSEGAMPDMDTLFEQSVAHDEVRRTQADALKPVGNYVTVPALNVQVSRIKEGANVGRTVIRFFGPAELAVTEKNAVRLHSSPGSVIRGQFGFGMSPERANKMKDGTDTGEPDHPSKLWAQAVGAYEVAHKTKAASIGDVVRYLQNYPVMLRVIQVGVPSDRNPEPDGEPGNIVMAINPVRDN